MQILKKLIYLLSSQERKHSIFLLLLIMIMALLDMAGVASILPFMAVLTNPNIIETNEILKSMFEVSKNFGVENNQDFLFGLGILVFILLVTSLLFKILMVYLEISFTVMREYSIGKRLVEGYLHQPYSWFLNRNSSDLGKNILSEVNSVVSNGISPMLVLISHSAVAIALTLLLILTEPKIAFLSFITLGLAYLLVFKLTRGVIDKFGKYRLKANQARFSIVNEVFGAVKEVKVAGLEQIYIERFSLPAQKYSKYQAMAGAIGQLPRYIIEIVTFGGILFAVLYLMSKNTSFLSIIPVLAVYTFAGYRLIPALQQIYLAITKLRYISPALDSLYNDLKSLDPKTVSPKIEPLKLKKSITLKNISYNYPYSKRTALKDISLSIPAGFTAGFVGTTGSGKTTSVDIILGLLEPQKGKLEVDGQIIDKINYRAWQNCIGYVPQQIFLADDTIEANIAFGVNTEFINKDAVQKASIIANLHDFVTNELPDQYQTKVGERGVRLSGGQRQRIGIARALYNNPEVLILDEATSALDNLTEKEIMDEVFKIGKNITVIMIAHRLTTVKKCDIIYLLENGKLKAKGKFNELIDQDNTFVENVNNSN